MIYHSLFSPFFLQLLESVFVTTRFLWFFLKCYTYKDQDVKVDQENLEFGHYSSWGNLRKIQRERKNVALVYYQAWLDEAILCGKIRVSAKVFCDNNLFSYASITNIHKKDKCDVKRKYSLKIKMLYSHSNVNFLCYVDSVLPRSLILLMNNILWPFTRGWI